MTGILSWQVSIKSEPQGRAHLLSSPHQQDFLGPPEELHWLSGLPATGNSRKRRMGSRHGQQEQGTSSRSRRMGSLTSRTR